MPAPLSKNRCSLPYRCGAHVPDRRGAHTAEFALVLPIILLLFFGGIEFARMNMLRHVVDNASYEAARHVIVPGATAQEGIDRAKSILAVMGAQNATVVITPNPIREETENVSVKVTLPSTGNMWAVSFFSSSMSFESETKLLTERGPMQQVKATGPPPPGAGRCSCRWTLAHFPAGLPAPQRQRDRATRCCPTPRSAGCC